MAGEILGAGISSAARLVGGLIDNFGASERQSHMDDQGANQQALQREFANTGVTWRARDVMRAAAETGLHPLSLLGVPGAAYAPVRVGDAGGGGLGSSIAGAGQDISRAVVATANAGERAGFSAQVQGLQVEGLRLDNEVKRATVQSLMQRTAQSVGPPMPTASGVGQEPLVGQPATAGLINFKPNEVTPQGIRGIEPGRQPDVSVINVPGGGFRLAPGANLQQRIEEIPGAGWQWWISYNLNLQKGAINEILGAPRAGHSWEVDLSTGVWNQRPTGGRSGEAYNAGVAGGRVRVNWLNRER